MQLFESVYKPRAGGMTAKAVTRTIAGADLSQTEVMLREAVQNSYDAHADNGKALDMELNCYKFSKEGVGAIKSLFENAGEIGKKFSEKISDSYYNLEISDRNTTGLSGYNGFREGERHTDDGEEKFHHFIYMTGNDEMKNSGSGGSFGFGKAALYRYSGLRTIVVYTRVSCPPIVNKYQTRFIICQIDERLQEHESRCWWGAEGHYNDGQSYAMPVNDNEADELAKRFGMTPFSDSETGTDILILNPVVEGSNVSFETTFTEEIPDLICHWFWPKIITGNERKRINFQMSFNRDDISENIPNPREIYPYRTFSEAFRRCTDYYGHKAGSCVNGMYPVTLDKPKVDIGAIFLKKVSVQDFVHDTYIHTDFSKPQVVLMRDVEFIVKYKELDVGTENSGMTCFGLFHTNRLGHQENGKDAEEIEHYFRDIENQTHTEWTHNDTQPRNYLRKLEKALPESVRQCLEIKSNMGNASSISGLVAQKFGAKLGFGFIGGASDEIKERSNSKVNSQKKESVFLRTKDPVGLEDFDGKTVLTLSYKASLRTGKNLKLFFTPVIRSSDPRESNVARDDEIRVIGLVSPYKRDNFVYYEWILKNEDGSYIVRKSNPYRLRLEASINCAFDVQIKKEEVDG